jgi:hypothetical protein
VGRKTKIFTGKNVKPARDDDFYEEPMWWVPPFSSLILGMRGLMQTALACKRIAYYHLHPAAEIHREQRHTLLVNSQKISAAGRGEQLPKRVVRGLAIRDTLTVRWATGTRPDKRGSPFPCV